MIREHGLEPEVIEYLKTPPSKETLKAMIAAAGITTRELLRAKEDVYAELGLDDPKWTDDELVDFMLQHPILMNRPIVVTPLGTRLCRPPELVLEILSSPQQGAFTKEDGEQLVDASGQQIRTPTK